MFNTKPRNILILAFSIFLVFGIFNSAIGPVLAELADQTNSTLAAVGSVLTFLFLGSLVTQLAAGPLIDRFGQKPLLLISLLLVAICLPIAINARSLPLMLAMVFFAGTGQGGLDLGANLMVSSAYPKNNTPVLNLLHFFFGVGAVIGPAVVSLTLSVFGTGRFIHWIAAGVFLIIAIVVAKLRENKHVDEQETDREPARNGIKKSVYLSPILWLLCFMVLVFVGVEYGSGSWATHFMANTTGMLKETGALITSAYWAAMTIGRLGGAALGSRISRIRLLFLAMIGSLVGAVVLTIGIGVTSTSIIAFILLGLSFGTIYPTSIGVMVSVFPKDQGKAVGLMTAMGSIGGLSLPWVAGILLEKVSPLAYALYMVAGGGLMLILLISLSKLMKKDSTE